MTQEFRVISSRRFVGIRRTLGCEGSFCCPVTFLVFLNLVAMTVRHLS